MPIQTSHSEADARTKWCPLVRPEYLANNPFKGRPLCIASDCMAWRFVSTHVAGPMKPDGSADLVPSNDTHGYCGLAGNPIAAITAAMVR